MSDSVFHIVEKLNGEIEIVQLVKAVKVKNNSKSNKEVSSFKCVEKKKSTIKEGCSCVMCQPVLEKRPENTQNQENARLTELSVLKNYSRAKVRNDAKKEANLTNNKKSTYMHNEDPEKDKVIDTTITIKTEPEIDIMDQDETELATENETINLQETSTFTEKDVFNEVDISNPQEAITPSSTKNEPNSSAKSASNIKQVDRFSNAQETITPNSTKSGSNKMPLLELTTKNIKCNVCGMVFTKSHNQLQSLRTHFLQHKTSVKRVFKKYTGVKYRKCECVGKSVEKLPVKKPLVLNKVMKGKEDLKSEKNSLLIKDVVTKLKNSSVLNIGNRKFIKLKKLPPGAVKKSDFRIGNTIIKNLRSTTNKSSKRDQTVAEGYVKKSEAQQQHKAMDSDDDIEIVEQKPELIVIDDNDDVDDKPCNLKSD